MAQQIINIDLKSQMDNSQVKKSISEIQSELDKAVKSNALRTMDKDAIKLSNDMQKVSSELKEAVSEADRIRNIKAPTQEYANLSNELEKATDRMNQAQVTMDKFAQQQSDLSNVASQISAIEKELDAANKHFGSDNWERVIGLGKQTVVVYRDLATNITYTAEQLQKMSDAQRNALTLGDAEVEERLVKTTQTGNDLRNELEDLRGSYERLDTGVQNNIANAERATQVYNAEKAKVDSLKQSMASMKASGTNLEVADPQALQQAEQRVSVLADKAGVYLQQSEQIKQKEAEIAREEALRLQKMIEINLNAGEINPKIAGTLTRLKEVRAELDRLVARQRDLEQAGAGLGHTEYDENLAKIRQLQDEQRSLVAQVNDYRDEMSGVTEETQQTISVTDTLKTLWSDIVNVIKSGIGVIQQVWKAVNNVVNAVKKIAQHTREANNEASKGSGHWQKTLWTIVKALIGVRGLYMLIRKIKKAAVEGFTNLTKESIEAQHNLELLNAKFLQLKNSVGAAIAPLADIVAPVIERIIDLFTRAFNAVAMFFGALSGKKTVMVAKTLDSSYGVEQEKGSKKKSAEEKYEEAVKKAQAKYEKELAKYQDKVAKAEAKQAKAAAKLAKEQEKVNKQLQGFDELNNLTSDDMDDATSSLEDYMAGLEEPELELPDKSDFEDAGGGGGLGDMFEEVAIDSGIADLADKVKQIFADLFAPIKTAWEDVGDFVVESWKKAWNSVKALVKDVWRDFIEVWKQDETVEIFRNIFRIIGDIGLIVSGLADKFREAWNENDKGLHILEKIRDIISAVVEWVRKAADYTVAWVETLDFNPLLQSVLDFLTAFEPVADTVVGILYDFYTKVLLPLGEWVLEKGLPQLVDILTYLADNIPWDKLREDLAEFWEHLEPFAETVGQGLIDFIKGLAERLNKWANSGKFEEFLDKIEQWMDDVSADDVKKLADDLFKFVEVMTKFIGIVADVAAEIGVENLAKMATAIFTYKTLNLGGIASSIGKFVGSIAKLIGTLALVGKLGGVGGIKSIVSTLFGKGAMTEATTVATQSGTAIGESVVTGTTTAIEGGAAATSAAMIGMAGVGVAAFGTLAVTGNKYADDMRKSLDPYEIDKYGDTLENLGNTYKDTADEMIRKSNDIRDASTESLNKYGDYAKTYADATELQKEAQERVTEADQNRIKAIQNLTHLEDYQYSLQNQGVMISEDLRVKLDEARHEVETTTQAYDDANRALDSVNDTLQFVSGQYDLVTDSAGKYAAEQAEIQKLNNNLQGDYSRQNEVMREQAEAQRQLANNTSTVGNAYIEIKDRVTEASTATDDYASKQAELQMLNNNLQGDYSKLNEVMRQQDEAQRQLANNTSTISTSYDTVKTSVEGVSSSMENATTSASDSLNKLSDAVSTSVDSIGTNVPKAQTHGTNIGKGVGSNAVTNVKLYAPKMKIASSDLMRATQEGAKSEESNTTNTFKGIADATLNVMKEGLSQNKFVSIGATALRGLISGFDSMKRAVVSKVQGIVSDVVSTFSGLGGKISNIMGDVMGSVSSTLSNVGDNVAKSVKSWQDSISSIDVDSSVKTTIETKTKVPKHATGQVIPPNMKEYLAILGDNNKETEVVSPLSTMKQAFLEAMSEGNFRGNSDGGGDIIIQIDGYEVFRAVRRQNDIFKKSTGSNAFA